jgi:hypothetical protein
VWTEFLISNLKLHIDVSITKRNYLWQITLLTVLIGGIGGWAYYSVFPHHYFGGYPLIPIFFLTFGVFMINMVESCRHRMPGRMLQIYLLMRYENACFYHCNAGVLCCSTRRSKRVPADVYCELSDIFDL